MWSPGSPTPMLGVYHQAVVEATLVVTRLDNPDVDIGGEYLLSGPLPIETGQILTVLGNWLCAAL
jgi:hypothetical protein